MSKEKGGRGLEAFQGTLWASSRALEWGALQQSVISSSSGKAPGWDSSLKEIVVAAVIFEGGQ